MNLEELNISTGSVKVSFNGKCTLNSPISALNLKKKTHNKKQRVAKLEFITRMISYSLSPEGEGERFFGESYGLQGELRGYQSSPRESKGFEGGRRLLNFECQ